MLERRHYRCPPRRRVPGARLIVLSVVALFAFCNESVWAQFLRIGPFDVSAEARLEGVYTTNVEGERESSAEEEREDYYIIAGIDMTGEAKMSPNTKLTLDTGISVERHFVRDDLDDSENPFGRIRLSAETQFRYTSVFADAYLERRQEKEDDTFVSGSRKKRDPTDEYGYNANVTWDRRTIAVGGSFSSQSERHDEEAFEDGDQDEITLGFSASWRPLSPLQLSYDFERTKTEFPNNPAQDMGWEDTETLSLGLNLNVWKRPRVTYILSYEREDDEDWEMVHTITVGDGLTIVQTPTLTVRLRADYSFERDEEDDDIAFTYAADINHAISRTASHSLNASREPRATFGSTDDTDSTTVNYNFIKSDLFIRGLNMGAGIAYALDRPPEGEDEITWTHTFSLAHVDAITRKLSRRFGYIYTREDLNTESEILDEHRITLSFIYVF